MSPRRTPLPARGWSRRGIAVLLPLLLVLGTGAVTAPASHADTESTFDFSSTALDLRVAARHPFRALLDWQLGGKPAARSVELQRRTAYSRWRTVTSREVAPGDHSLVVRPRSLGRYRYRLHAPASDRRAAISSPTVRYARAIGYRPRGRAYQHSSLFSTNARWNPCQTITWRANLDGAWPGALRNLRKAMRRTAWASGLSFRYLGSTDVVPDGTVGQTYPADTALVVAWAAPGTTPLLPADAPHVLGSGGGVAWDRMVDEAGRPAHEIRTGRVVISTRAAATLEPGFGKGHTRGSLLIHEIGHAVGLGHVASRAQLMNPTVQDTVDRWGRGDLRGLAVHGATRGCLSPMPHSQGARMAPPRPVSVSADQH